MKRKLIVIILVILGLSLILYGAFKILSTGKKEKIDYADATIAYDAVASFQEKNEKAYVEYEYTNNNNKPVILKKAKLFVYNSETKKSIYEEELKLNKVVEPQKSVTIKFKELDISLEELIDFYPEVIIN